MQTQVFLPKTGFSVSGSPNPCFELSRSRFGSGIHLIEFSTLIFTRSPASKDSQPRVRIRKPSRDRHGLCQVGDMLSRGHEKLIRRQQSQLRSYSAVYAPTELARVPHWETRRLGLHCQRVDLLATWPHHGRNHWGSGRCGPPKVGRTPNYLRSFLVGVWWG